MFGAVRLTFINGILLFANNRQMNETKQSFFFYIDKNSIFNVDIYCELLGASWNGHGS